MFNVFLNLFYKVVISLPTRRKFLSLHIRTGNNIFVSQTLFILMVRIGTALQF